jgi:hypothetical protein
VPGVDEVFRANVIVKEGKVFSRKRTKKSGKKSP